MIDRIPCAETFRGIEGTYFSELEGEVEELSLQELQELIRALTKRVEQLEQHHAKF